MRKALICLLLASAAYAKTIDYNNSSVQKINVVIDAKEQKKYDKNQIVSKLLTQVGHRFYQEDFDSDLKMLASEFDSVQPSISEGDGTVTITLFLTPKPLISRVEFSGNKAMKSSKLRKEMGIKPLTHLSQAEIQRKLKKLKEFYIKSGYFESQITTELRPLKDNEAILKIHVKEGRSGKVHNIKINGVSKKEKKAISEMLQTKAYFLLTSWFSGTGIYHEEMLEQDKMVALNYLQNLGYANASIKLSIDDAPKNPGMVDISLDVERGEIYKFDQITFGGNSTFNDEQVQGAIYIKQGDDYSPEKIRNTQQSIQDLYGKHGYIDTNIYYETHLNPENKTYSVHYDVQQAKQYRIGLIRVIGNDRTNKSVILHESLLVPGEVFDSRKLQATEQRLYNIGYFKRVNVYAAKPNEDDSSGPPYYRDVYIEVEETTTGSFNLFGGYSSKDDLFAGIELGEKNFNIRGIGQIFSHGLSALRGGGEYFHIRLNLGTKETFYTVTWMTPYLFDSMWRFGVELFKNKVGNYSDLYKVKTYGGTVFLSYPINSYWSFGTNYTLKDSNNIIPAEGVTVINNGVEEHLTQAQIRATIPRDGITSLVGANLSYDSTDSASRPSRGFRSTLEGQVAGLGGDFDFFKLGYLNSYYIPVHRGGVLKTRFDLRFVYPFGNTRTIEKASQRGIPVADRFFMGGIGTVRGFKTNIIGPMKDGSPIGGLSYALGSIEYIWHAFPPLLQFFVFYDAGANTEKEFTVGQVRQSVGAGIRLDLMGQLPLTFGYGYPFRFSKPGTDPTKLTGIYAERDSLVKKWFVSVGAQY